MIEDHIQTMNTLLQISFILIASAHSVIPRSHFSFGPSSLTREFRRSIPEDAVWSHVTSCGYDHALNRVLLFDPAGELQQLTQTSVVLLAKSRYDAFAALPPAHNIDSNIICKDTKFWANIVKRPLVVARECSRVLEDRPVILYKLLNFRVGHLLSDLIENIHYYTSVVGVEESHTPPTFILAAMDGKAWSTTFQELFTILAGASPMLLSTFNAHDGVTCIRNLHVGVDEFKSYVTDGWRATTGSTGSTGSSPLVQHYKAYQKMKIYFVGSLILSGFAESVPQEQKGGLGNCQIVHVIRGRNEGNGVHFSTRHITNTKEVLNVLAKAAPSCSLRVMFLDHMTFKEQFQHFRQSDMFVGLAGSALHNSVFLKDNAVVINIMQQGWCNVRWWFERQMLLSNVWPLTLCDEPLHHRVHFRWHRSGWLVGPWYTKNTPSTVNISLLRNAVYKGIEMISNSNKTSASELSDRTSLNPTRTQPQHPFGKEVDVQLEHETDAVSLHLTAATGGVSLLSADRLLSLVPVAVVTQQVNITQQSMRSQLKTWMKENGFQLAFCASILEVGSGIVSAGIATISHEKRCLPLNATHEYSTLQLPTAKTMNTHVIKFWFERDGQLLQDSEGAWFHDETNDTVDMLALMVEKDWHLHGISTIPALTVSMLRECVPVVSEDDDLEYPIELHPFTIQHNLYYHCASVEEDTQMFMSCMQCLVEMVKKVIHIAFLGKKTSAFIVPGSPAHQHSVHVSHESL